MRYPDAGRKECDNGDAKRDASDMSVRKIIRMGHPALRRPAREIRRSEVGGGPMRRLVSDMIDTLHDYGGIGLAAPQINEGIRLAITEIPGGPTRYGPFIFPQLTQCGLLLPFSIRVEHRVAR